MAKEEEPPRSLPWHMENLTAAGELLVNVLLGGQSSTKPNGTQTVQSLSVECGSTPPSTVRVVCPICSNSFG